jgi:hypothetical protein
MMDGTAGRTWPVTSLIALLGFVFVPAGMTVAGLSWPGEQPPSEADTTPDGLMYTEPDEPSLRRIDRWVESRVPGRELAFEFDRATTRILDDNYTGAIAATDRVQIGDQGWLFLSDSTAQPCVNPAQEQEWATEIARVQRLLEDAGKQMVIAIAPDRAIMIPELTGDISNECQRQNTAAIDRLAESSAVVDLGDAVSGEEHALQIDTHWSPTGAMAGARAVVEAIRPGTWEERTLESEVVERRGDLDGLLGYENTESVNLLTIDQPEPTSLEALPTSIPGRPLVRARTPGAAEHHVLLIHDSFGGYTLAEEPSTYLSGLAAYYVRPWFDRVDNVRVAGISSSTIADEPVVLSLRDAETVAILMVQRTLPVRLLTGGLSTPLAAALVDQLGAPFDPSQPAPSAGVVVLEGLSGAASDSIELDVKGGSIQSRTDYPDRIVLSVEKGTTISTTVSPESWRFVSMTSPSS